MSFLRSPFSLTGTQDGNRKKARKKSRRTRGHAYSSKRRILEALEDRIALSHTPVIYVDLTNTGGTDLDPDRGTQFNPYNTIQAALDHANGGSLFNGNVGNDRAEEIRVYGNGTSLANTQAYIFTRDSDRNNDNIADGNMFVSDEPNIAGGDRLVFIAKQLNRTGDPDAGAFAPVVVKLNNNIIDVAGELRVEGESGYSTRSVVLGNAAAGFPVVFTSIEDTTVAGDSDVTLPNTPERRDWGGIRFRGGAVDQGLDERTGSLINNAVIRYTGANLPDPIAGIDPNSNPPGQRFTKDFASIRMEYSGAANRLTTFNENEVSRVRVLNTSFEHGGEAFNVDFWALEGRGPDIRNVTFADNSINGLAVSIPFDTIQGVPNLPFSSQWDDLGVPYVLTQRLNVVDPTQFSADDTVLTIDAGMVVKLTGQAINARAARMEVNGTTEQPVIFTSLRDDGAFNPLYPNVFNLLPPDPADPNGAPRFAFGDTNNDLGASIAGRGDWGGLEVTRGHIDYARVTYGGGIVPELGGVFDSVAPISIQTSSFGLFAFFGPDHFRVSNTEITLSRGLTQGNLRIPALESYGTGTVEIVDNFIHNNPDSIAIRTDDGMYYDLVNPLGGYGIHFRRNRLENNSLNGVFSSNLNTTDYGFLNGYLDDTDIVQVIGQDVSTPNPTAWVTQARQVLQLMSRREVTRTVGTDGRFEVTPNGPYLTDADAEAAFIARLQQQGALEGTNNVPNRQNFSNDNGLFYRYIDFEATARQERFGVGQVTGNGQGDPGNLFGDEWRDYGVEFYVPGSNASVFMPLSARSNQQAGDLFRNSTPVTLQDRTSTNSPTNGVSTSAINVTGNFTVSDVNVHVNISHARVGDLRLELVGPNGTTVRLVNQKGFEGDNFANTAFDDEALLGVESALAPFSGTFRPEGSLSAFDGLASLGTWTLRITDLVTGQVGTLNNWALRFDSPSFISSADDVFTPQSGQNILTTANPGLGTLEMVFPNQVSAVGFWIVDNESTSAAEKIEFFDAAGNLLESRSLPQTGPDGRTFVGRMIDSSTSSLTQTAPIYRIVITERGNDGDVFGIDDLYFVDAGESLVVKFDTNGIVQAGGFDIQRDANEVEANDVDNAGRLIVGGTFRVLGQPNDPVVMTSLRDDSAGAGHLDRGIDTSGNVQAVSRVQNDTNNDGSQTVAAPGDWQGIKLLHGINTSRIENVVQNPNGTVTRTSSDSNPYTIGDDLAFTFGNFTRRLSDTDDIYVNPNNGGTANGVGRGVFNVDDDDAVQAGWQQRLQDGTLIEHADIRYAIVGVESFVYPDGKLAIEGTESEDNDSTGTADPLLPMVEATDETVRFRSNSGAVRVGGKLGSSPFGDLLNEPYDPDYFKLPTSPPPQFGSNFFGVPVYVDVDNAESGIAVWVFNALDQLIYFNDPSFTLQNFDPDGPLGPLQPISVPGQSYVGGVGSSFIVNNLAPPIGSTSAFPVPGSDEADVVVWDGNRPFDVDPNSINFLRRDATYIVLSAAGHEPRIFNNTDNVRGNDTVNSIVPMALDENGRATGFTYTVRNTTGGLVATASNSTFVGTDIRTGAYEMEVRLPKRIGGQDLHNGPNGDAVRADEGDIIIRQNRISHSQVAGVALRDTVEDLERAQTGATAVQPSPQPTTGSLTPLQAARYVYDTGRSSGFANQHDLIPGIQVYNNIVVSGSDDGIVTSENTNVTAGSGAGRFVQPVPAGFHQITNNTIDDNDGDGIEVSTRSGPNVLNNIISNNGGVAIRVNNIGTVTNTGIGGTIFDPPFVANNGVSAPVVDFNLLFNNAGGLIIGNTNSSGRNLVGDPLFVDANNTDPRRRDYRILQTSPAVDSAISDLPDRLGFARTPDEASRAPNDDYLDRRRADNLRKDNTGQGTFRFFDRGALESVDFIPLPGVTIGDVTITEGNSGQKTVTFVLTLDRTLATDVTVDFTTGEGTATAGEDFVARTGTVTFAAGTSTQTIDIQINGDTVPEADETFFVNLTTTETTIEIVDATGIGTIENDDAPPTVRINSGVQVIEGEPGDNNRAVFTVTLSSPSGSPITVQYATRNRTALAGSDYEATTGTVTFQPGETSKTIEIPIIPDNVLENSEQFEVRLSNPVNATLGPSRGRATILDDDGPEMRINDVRIVEGNTGTKNAVFTVTLDTPSNGNVQVNYATANGTATAGSDYRAVSGRLTFAAGESSKTISVPIIGDTLPESTETFLVNLSNATGSARLADPQGIGRITNDDRAPRISIGDVTLNEGNSGTTAFTFSVQLNRAVSFPVTVNFATRNGTARSSDYTAASGTVTFAPGQTARPVTIFVRGDRTVENHETFFVNLSGATNATISDPQAVGTIRNDDSPRLRKGGFVGSGSSADTASTSSFRTTSSNTTSRSLASTSDFVVSSNRTPVDEALVQEYARRKSSTTSSSLSRLLAWESAFENL